MAISNAALQIASPQLNTAGAAVDAKTATMAQQAEQQRQTAFGLQQKREAMEGIYMMSAGLLRDGKVDPAEWDQALGLMEQGGADKGFVESLRGHPEMAQVLAKGSAEALKYSQDERQMDLRLQELQMNLAAAAAPKPTDDMRELAQVNEERQKAGQPPISTEEWLKSKPASSTTQIIMPGDPDGGTSRKSFQEGLGGIKAKEYGTMMDEAKAARTSIGTLKVMEDQIANPGFYSGIGSDQILQLKRMATAIGLDPAGVDSMESFAALNKQAALQAMGGSLGTGFSNADRDFVVEQVPALTNTPKGNKKIIEIQQAIAQRKIEIADLATKYVQEHKVLDAGFDQELAQYAEAHPIFQKEDSGNKPPAANSGMDELSPADMSNEDLLTMLGAP